jgi:hypothetical protein
VLAEYVQLLITAIRDSFPLLSPHPHQFLLRFMITRGWEKVKVLEFFFFSSERFHIPTVVAICSGDCLPVAFDAVARNGRRDAE